MRPLAEACVEWSCSPWHALLGGVLSMSCYGSHSLHTLLSGHRSCHVALACCEDALPPFATRRAQRAAVASGGLPSPGRIKPTCLAQDARIGSWGSG